MLHDDPFPAFLHEGADPPKPTPQVERARPASWVSGALKLSQSARHPGITLPRVKWLEEWK